MGPQLDDPGTRRRPRHRRTDGVRGSHTTRTRVALERSGLTTIYLTGLMPAIQTRSLTLVPHTPEDVRAQIEGMDARQKAELSPVWLEQVRGVTGIDPWILGFALVDRATDAVVGTCGFKGPPNTEGIVEIAYGVAPAHLNKGYATEAAEALVAFAFGSGQVQVVCAHTIAEANASSRVLTKCGFLSVGQVIDPEDGLVWRWERRPPAKCA